MPFDIDPLEMWRAMQATLSDAGDRAGAARVVRRSVQWLRSICDSGPSGPVTKLSHKAS
jgi:hypothetical protein